jgi:diphosphomevalonate decarboxylase
VDWPARLLVSRPLLRQSPLIDSFTLSQLSRRGSGSSCRSFFEPFSVWDKKGASRLALEPLLHQVVVVDSKQKAVSSSQAHSRVLNSDLWSGRTERAEKRFEKLLEAMKHDRWKDACEIVWSEFWDMHALFETSHPAFGYMQEGSLTVQTLARGFWKDRGDGPMVTMDAGPNVHLLYRQDQAGLMREFYESRLKGFRVLGDGLSGEEPRQ